LLAGPYFAILTTRDVVKVLLTENADKDAKLPSGFTAMMIAAQNGHA
jgi:ankyrin repeat protein